MYHTGSSFTDFPRNTRFRIAPLGKVWKTLVAQVSLLRRERRSDRRSVAASVEVMTDGVQGLSESDIQP